MQRQVDMNDTGPKEVGYRLQQIRKNRTRKEFADELGISGPDYVFYESGRREIPTSLLVALLEKCAVDPAWVLTGKRLGTVAEKVTTATVAYKAILEAAQRAEVTLLPEVFSYAIAAALPAVARNNEIDAEHADVLVKLATINSK
jgi:transcriptional regulator with XRE-family HTH domain